MRREFSPKIRLAAFDRAHGHCESCGVKLGPHAGVEYDHIVPAAIGGGNELENCQCLCRNCHGAKTHGTAPGSNSGIAKGKRARAKHIGAERKTGFRKAGDGYRFDWSLGRYVATGD